ncbi:FMN-binding protein [Flagellimonas zhangzhouensis]|uniref:FMN-binding domain-containing protein n=1 Tax=Flagellimonas zhangzhouensis TaxID=1073328 RepID=A0A1H2QW71_9FLAO|nr:FMN-binding protein [Allomuricauda zhangzhouensis]SDQ57329.1 FMN-binding domain-containing protein [Allomuricauda zhangzhouensis]SDW11375.1 FMN-binding domain-containing protein [Allomuricauda zhangzhouensis]
MKWMQVCGFLLALLVLFGFENPNELNKRALKEVAKTFETESFTVESISVSDSENVNLSIQLTGQNFFRIISGDNLLGYAFFDQAPSKTAKFDYLVVFNAQLKVINTKVLVYREEYGGEIGSKRWLKQFLGKTGGDRVSVNSNIDVISGATISVNSMTKAMDNLLVTIGMLQDKNLL